MHSASLRLEAPDAATADAVRRALLVELADGHPGARTTLSVEGHTLIAQVEGEQLSGVRAAITGLVRLGDAALGSLASSSSGPRPAATGARKP